MKTRYMTLFFLPVILALSLAGGGASLADRSSALSTDTSGPTDSDTSVPVVIKVIEGYLYQQVGGGYEWLPEGP